MACVLLKGLAEYVVTGCLLPYVTADLERKQRDLWICTQIVDRDHDVTGSLKVSPTDAHGTQKVPPISKLFRTLSSFVMHLLHGIFFFASSSLFASFRYFVPGQDLKRT